MFAIAHPESARLAAAVCAAAALFTAIRGPKTAAEAEPRLHTPEPPDNSGEP